MMIDSTVHDKTPFERTPSATKVSVGSVLDNPFGSSVHLAPRDAALYDLNLSLSPSSKSVPLPLPEHSTHVPEDETEYLSGGGGDASERTQAISMPESSAPSSDSGRQSGSARPRSHPQANPSPRRHQPPRPPFPSPSVHTYPPGQPPNPQDTQQGYQGHSPHYQSPSPFGQSGAFMGPQYTMSHAQQPMNIVTSSPQNSYPRRSEPSMQHIAYTSSAMMPMMQPLAPMYQFQNHTPDGAPVVQHPFTGAASRPPLAVYSHLAVNSSPPPHSPLPSSQQGSAGSSVGPPHSSSYASQGVFAPIGYQTPPQYAYAPQSSYTSSPSIYQSQYAPSPYGSYGQSEQESQGTWWYMPASSTPSGSYDSRQPSYSPYNMGYPQMGRREGSHSGPSSLPAVTPPVSTSQPRQPNQSRFGGSLVDATTDASSPVPTPQPAASIRASETVAPSNEVERNLSRQPYHPNPPAHRSEWVMWAGNVPSDATHDELWRYFNQPPPPSDEPGTSTPPQDEVSGGVLSIFLISRSNCTFVNFESEAHLSAATSRFNGVPLRPSDPRCPRLVCRIRRQTDDLRAGVGGQRGIGMHTKWVRDQKEKAQRESGRPGSPDRCNSRSAGSSPENLGGGVANLSLSDDEGIARRRSLPSHSNSSGSFASTSSGMLARYFPRRYFILKSLTQFDLDLSVQKGVWATQRHNEGILDQAFRTSRDVFLIFGVNKSGEFYGYARMTGSVSKGEDRVPWASPPTSSQSSSHVSGAAKLPTETNVSPVEPVSDETTEPRYIFPADEHRVDESPMPVSSSQEMPPFAAASSRTRAQWGQAASAPAELRDPHEQLTFKTPQEELSLDVHAMKIPRHSIHLDSMAPYRAIRSDPEEETSPGSQDDRAHSLEDGIPSPRRIRRELSEPSHVPTALRPVEEVTAEAEETRDDPPLVDGAGQDRGLEETWGQPFRIEWMRTERLPFHRTRHLRNPWNHGREIKVSRDGTELEPSVGQQLLEEWDRTPPSPSVSPAAVVRPVNQRRGSKPQNAP